MHISPFRGLQKWQDQLHFDRNIKALWFIPTCVIVELFKDWTCLAAGSYMHRKIHSIEFHKSLLCTIRVLCHELWQKQFPVVSGFPFPWLFQHSIYSILELALDWGPWELGNLGNWEFGNIWDKAVCRASPATPCLLEITRPRFGPMVLFLIRDKRVKYSI